MKAPQKHPERSRLPTSRARQLFRAFQEFAQLEAAGGIVLIAATVAALVWANSPWADLYTELWHTPVQVGFGEFTLVHDLHWWINEGLMVLFFLVVGLEIKREIIVGELSSIRKATLPVFAAIGGMIIPALIYILINREGPGMRGWGVPMATDIAFALGVMALLGSRVPISLKIFLTALAIVDDIGAVLVIAIFYTGEISPYFLALAVAFWVLLVIANVLGVRSSIIYALLGIGLWISFLGSGLHATLAGVILAFMIPAAGVIRSQEFLRHTRIYLDEFEHAGETDKRLLNTQQQEALLAIEETAEQVQTPLQRMEHSLHPWVTFLIMPLFALSNAGVELGTGFFSLLVDRISLGIIAGLVIGKQIGITLAAWIAVKTGLADLPEGVSWTQIYGSGWLAGIGFTMSLFISSLAFGNEPGLDNAKIGILAASITAGLMGYLILRFRSSPQENKNME